MKKVLAFFTLMIGFSFLSFADCYFNELDQQCCENGEMFCGADPQTGDCPEVTVE